MKHKRRDNNHTEVVHGLRRLGLAVTELHNVGGGVPDLLVGYSGFNFLIELKSTEKIWLTEDEDRWHREWTGQSAICNSLEQIIKTIYLSLMKIHQDDLARQLREKWKERGLNR